MKESLKSNPMKFYSSVLSLILGVVGLVLYLATGKVRGLVNSYSTVLIIVAMIGIAANTYFTIKRINTWEMIPFMSYVIVIMLFASSESPYIVAVIRAIDYSSFSGGFIMTIICFAMAAISYLVSFGFKEITE